LDPMDCTVLQSWTYLVYPCQQNLTTSVKLPGVSLYSGLSVKVLTVAGILETLELYMDPLLH
jgi:hypothetical protein